VNINYIVLLICAAFCLFMFFYFKWYIKHRTSASGLLPEQRAEINRLIAELDFVTERNVLLVEDKIKKLKEILDDTDKRISVYVKELEKSRTGEALYTNLGRGIRAALKTEAETAQGSLNGAVQQSAQQSAPVLSSVRPSIEEKPQVPSAGEMQDGQTQQAKQKPQSKRQIRASIDLLANEGLPADKIASRLDISIAEVELAMNLRRKSK